MKQSASVLKDMCASMGYNLSLSLCYAFLKSRYKTGDTSNFMSDLPGILADIISRLQAPMVGAVEGVQQKFWVGDILYKVDNAGQSNGMVEYVVSRAISNITYKGVVPQHVLYTPCEVNGKSGCYCNSFLPSEDWAEIPFSKLPGGQSMHAIRSSIWADNLAIVFLLDVLFKNGDRHTSNFSILKHTSGIEQFAPLFDFGASDLSRLSDPYCNFNPEPFGREQIVWAKSHISEKLVFDYSTFSRSVNSADTMVDIILDYARDPFVSSFLEVV